MGHNTADVKWVSMLLLLWWSVVLVHHMAPLFSQRPSLYRYMRANDLYLYSSISRFSCQPVRDADFRSYL